MTSSKELPQNPELPKEGKDMGKFNVMEESPLERRLRAHWAKIPSNELFATTWPRAKDLAKRIARAYKPNADVPALIQTAMDAIGVTDRMARVQYRKALASFFGASGGEKSHRHSERPKRVADRLPTKAPVPPSLRFTERTLTPEEKASARRLTNRMLGEKDD